MQLFLMLLSLIADIIERTFPILKLGITNTIMLCKAWRGKDLKIEDYCQISAKVEKVLQCILFVIRLVSVVCDFMANKF